MAAAGVDIVVLGGVPINLSKGHANAEQMIVDLEAELNVKVSTSASAQAKAARALGCRKVVVAQPYELSETDRIASYGAHFGCEVLGATGWGAAFNQIGRIPRHAALDMGRRLMREHPDAEFDPAAVAALADGGIDRRTRARARGQRDGGASGDRLGRAAALRRQRPHRGIWTVVPGVLTDANEHPIARSKDLCGCRGASCFRLPPGTRTRSRSSSRPASPIRSTRCWPGTWRATPASMPRKGSRSRSSTCTAAAAARPNCRPAASTSCMWGCRR